MTVALRCVDGQRPQHLASALQVLDMVRDVPELQTPTRRLGQGLCSLGDLCEGTPPSVRWLFKASKYSVWVATSSGL